MYNTCDDLLNRYFARMEEISQGEWYTDLELKRLHGLYEVYRNALVEAEKYGWIGVGCITYAENRLQEAQKMNLVDEGVNQ